MGIAIFFALIVGVVAIAAHSQSGGMFSGANGSSGVKPIPRSKKEAQRMAKEERREKRVQARMKKAVQREKQIQEYENAINGMASPESKDSSHSSPARSHLNDALTRGFGRS